MRFMSYFPLFLICVSQYYLQGVNASNINANELIDFGERLTQQSEQLFKKTGQRKKRDYSGTSSDESGNSRSFGPNNGKFKETLYKLYGVEK
ncbi:Hypothetical protein SRAE_X000055500 [Strongyloides ratti]|uniref:Uncharacterized protein n=1 Tax=Strongyloides ratti TaxID=34506 RepID=A0A090N0T1_STRRB|nr:Hypothetical protein SRAE_X000055500 [Strongyloides ratti]CEF71228.1 Hypothetical protein SRAE_X000055500 [Strongyloides ratti]